MFFSTPAFNVDKELIFFCWKCANSFDKACTFKLDFYLTVHHQLGKIIQMNQLDATMIY